jgi:2-methylcitrate dehydratase
VVAGELAVADAHPNGAAPFARPDYIAKFDTLTRDIISGSERARVLEVIQRLPELSAEELVGLTVAVADLSTAGDATGIF